MNWVEHIHRMSEGRVLVVGDIMLDRYLWGEVERISPEAPVPIVRVRERSHVLGGAGNVVANLAGLKCPAVLIGVRGDDNAGNRLMGLLHDNGVESHILVDPSRPTITKTRILAQGQQLLRLDEEEPRLLDFKVIDQLMGLVRENLPYCQPVILSDYGKGVFQSPGIAQAVIALGRQHNVPVLVDPKGEDWERYQSATCVTPNMTELEIVAATVAVREEAKLVAEAQRIRQRYHLDWLLVTRGSQGMCLLGREEPAFFIPAHAREVFDVSGAGDTVIATLAAARASGLPFPSAAQLANVAAGIVVGKLGTQPITLTELEAAVQVTTTTG